MEITIQIKGQAVSVEVSVEVYTYLDQADHRDENLAHELCRNWTVLWLLQKRSHAKYFGC